MKKILASLVALAMFVSVAVVMVGCGNNINGEYKYSHATYTVITKVEDGKVTETKTYSEEEYVKIVYVWAAVDASKTAEEALEVELDEDQTKEYEEMLEEIQAECRENVMFGEEYDAVKMVLKNGKAQLIGTTEEDGAYSYSKEELVYEGTYEVKEDTLYFKALGMDGEGRYRGLEDYGMAGYSITKLAIDKDAKTATYTKYQHTDENYDYTGLEFSATNYLAYRTDLVFVEA